MTCLKYKYPTKKLYLKHIDNLFLLKKGQFTVNHLIKTILKQKFHINVRDSLQSNLKWCC